jgi:hypothetical protein
VNALSDGQSEGNREWVGLVAGGLVGLALILLANVFPGLIPSDGFASLNILFFLCILLSPYALNVALFHSSEQRGLRVAMIVCYLASALIVGWMIAFLARGDNYYGIIVIPVEVSWVVVTVVAALLLVPLINWFSLLPIAAWLGSLLYYKVYLSSQLSRVLIGSPLFALPTLVLLGYEICEVIRTHQGVLYVLDTVRGELTSHHFPRRRIPLRRVLAVSSFLLAGSSAIVTGLSGCALFAWNESALPKALAISEFKIDNSGSILEASFSLINAKNEIVTADGTAELYLYNAREYLIYSERLSFSNRGFTKSSKGWVYSWSIPKTKLNWGISGNELAAEAIQKGSATLRVLVNGQSTHYTSTCLTTFNTKEEAENIIKEVYRNVVLGKLVQWLEQNRYSISEYGNLGWALDITVMDLAVIGKNAWGVGYLAGIGGYGHILHSPDGGNTWEIQWKSSTYGPDPFKVVFLNETEGWVAANKVLLHTTDGGITWNAIWSRNQLFGGYLRGFQVTDRKNLQISLSGVGVLYTSDGGETWQSK